MRRPRKAITARALPDTTLRRLRNTPSYFFLVWRWSTWLYALITIGSNFSDYSDDPTYSIKKLAIVLLSITFVQTLAVTLYTPVIQIIVPRLPVLNTLAARRRPPAEDEEADLLTPLARTSNPYWDIAVLCSDVFICGLVMYYGGAITSNPPFGDGSPFYRYGFSTVYAAAFSYRYRGSLAAAIGYDLFAVYGMFVFPPGTSGNYKVINATDVAGSLMDAPIVAVLSAYVVTLLARYTSSKREQQANVRRQRALLKVNEIILREANNRPLLLQKVAEQLRQGGHFQRLVIAMVNATSGTGGKEQQHTDALLGSCIEVSISDTQLPAVNQAYIEQVLRSQQRLVSFELFKESPGEERGIARLYLPFYREGQIQMIIGAESWRQTPFDSKQENFLVLAGAQLLLALDNIRLTEQTVELAATAERGRIAREIHDGIAQLTYMLSLNAETCATQARRIAEASEEDGELIIPLAQRLEKMVTVSKQALWETRNYMFSLKPLMSGTTTLTQMLTNQLREFETISDLPVQLDIEGSEIVPGEDQLRVRRYAQVGTAIFRIVQEALTNAYKHAEASKLQVRLSYLPDSISVEVSDNGKGLPDGAGDGTEERIYSGHGMRGMRERAEELGGTLQMDQPAGGGLRIQVQMPL